MKGFLLKITAVFIALTVLVSTVTITVDRHYCNGILVDLAVFGRALPCDMSIGVSSKESPYQQISKNNNKCKHFSDVFVGEDIEQQAHEKIQLSIVFFVTNFIQYFTSEVVTKSAPFFTYKPPLIYRDIHLFLENFRI